MEKILSKKLINEGIIKKLFIKYLIDRGYKEYTPSGHPSTVYDYVKRIEQVISWENYDGWKDVERNISDLCLEYGIGGKKEKLGKISHNSVISAIRRFSEFCADKILDE